MIPVTPEEVDLLARTVWGEARGESVQGKWAVAWVAINRTLDARKRWPRSLAGVLLQPKQFTCWSGDNPDCKYVSLGTKSLRECFAAIWQVLAEIAADPTYGSNHYLTRTLAENAPPEWFDWKNVQLHSGGHVFLRID